MNNGETRSADV